MTRARSRLVVPLSWPTLMANTAHKKLARGRREVCPPWVIGFWSNTCRFTGNDKNSSSVSQEGAHGDSVFRLETAETEADLGRYGSSPKPNSDADGALAPGVTNGNTPFQLEVPFTLPHPTRRKVDPD